MSQPLNHYVANFSFTHYKAYVKQGPWWWSSGQLARLLFWRSSLNPAEVCNNLYCRTKINVQEDVNCPLLKKKSSFLSNRHNDALIQKLCLISFKNVVHNWVIAFSSTSSPVLRSFFWWILQPLRGLQLGLSKIKIQKCKLCHNVNNFFIVAESSNQILTLNLSLSRSWTFDLYVNLT